MTYAKALAPRVDPTTTSTVMPINHDIIKPTDFGVASNQYIRNKCIQSGENEPSGNVDIVSAIEIKNDIDITRKLFIYLFLILLWFIVPN